jgi:hypothetical protein
MTKLKFIGFIAAVMLIAAGMAINVNHSTNVSGLSDVSLSNVEALANNESGTDGDCSKVGGSCEIKLPDGLCACYCWCSKSITNINND